jgi:hypothetical protein
MAEHNFGQRADVDEALEVFSTVGGQENFAITIQPGRGDLAGVVDVICDLVFDIGNLTVALEEIPHYCTAGWMPDGLDVLSRMGRHRRIDLVYTGQRFAELPRMLTATTDYFVLFGQREPRDLEALADPVGRDVAEKVERLPLHGRVIFDVMAGGCVAERGRGRAASWRGPVKPEALAEQSRQPVRRVAVGESRHWLESEDPEEL